MHEHHLEVLARLPALVEDQAHPVLVHDCRPPRQPLGHVHIAQLEPVESGPLEGERLRRGRRRAKARSADDADEPRRSRSRSRRDEDDGDEEGMERLYVNIGRRDGARGSLRLRYIGDRAANETGSVTAGLARWASSQPVARYATIATRPFAVPGIAARRASAPPTEARTPEIM